MHSGPNHDALLVSAELFGLSSRGEEVLVLKLLILIGDALFGGNRDEVNWSALQSADDV
jgi:hypothetical protein